MFTPVILAGGSGTRLWPLSRQLYPKQLLPLCADGTMLQETAHRACNALTQNSSSPVVICNEEHRFLVAEQLREAGIEPRSILLEPVGRNTAPALTIAALAVGDPGTVLFVTPADHVIKDHTAYARAVQKAAQWAEQGVIVTFGVVPTAPETGYGYIKRSAAAARQSPAGAPEAFEVETFLEKPDEATAMRLLEGGDHYWNSGMFMVRAGVWLDLIGSFRPDMLSACEKAYRNGKADRDFFRLDPVAFEQCPSDSIDYAVMEPLTQRTKGGADALVIPLDCGWSDVGVWNALWDVQPKDDDGNVIRGDVFAANTRNTLVYAQQRLVAVLGIEDAVVVETGDAVLIANKTDVQGVKEVVQWLQSERRDEHLNHTRVYRPWGSFECIDLGERFKVKRIVVNPGASLSLQMHHHRAEHWIVVRGTASVTREDESFLVSENESTFIPVGTRHRLANPGAIPLEMIEVQSGSYLGEDDIVRFRDEYGRDS